MLTFLITHKLLPNTDINAYSGGLKAVGAGLGRTGTLSLKAALAIIYGAPCYHMADNIRYGQSGFWLEACHNGKTPEEWQRFYQCYAACVDLPACFFFAETHQAFPEAQIILSTRSADSWYNSCKDTVFLMQPGNVNQPWGVWFFQNIMPFGPGRVWRQMMYEVWDTRYFNGDYSKENAVKIYNNWIEHVKRSCQQQDKQLLIHEAKEGWEPLCAFLKVPVPDCPYPNVNDTKEFHKILCECICVHLHAHAYVSVPFPVENALRVLTSAPPLSRSHVYVLLCFQ